MAAVLPHHSNTKDGLHNLSQPLIHLVIPPESSESDSHSHSESSLSPTTLDDEGQKQRKEEVDDRITMISTAATAADASFIPSSSSSPISFRDEEEDGDDNDNDNDRRHHPHLFREQDPPILCSIMRQQTQTDKCGGGGGGGGEEELAELSPDQEKSEKSCVAALEERVRDLEEKLSTLSLLLSQPQRMLPNYSQQQQQQQHQSPEKNSMKINHCLPSPINSVRSVSPSSSPFRSLSSYTNMPLSTAPVLESPAPIATHYQSIDDDDDDDDDDDFKSNRNNCDCSLPYEDRRRQNKSRHRNMRNNLSFQILHGTNDTLDLSGVNSIDSVASGNITRDASKLADAMLRIPSLDSLPGSERTSPVPLLPSSPVIAAPNASLLKEDRENSSNNNGNRANISTKLRAFLSPHINKSNNEHDDDRTTTTTAKDADGDTPEHKKKKSNIKSKWLDYLNSVQESNYDTDKQMEGKKNNSF